MTLRSLGLLMRTARHLKMSQISARAARMARVRRWSLLRTPAPVVEGAVRDRTFRSSWPEALDHVDRMRARDIVEGRFEFLGVVREHPSWNPQDVSQLWRFHLHYFDYAIAFAALGAVDEFRALAQSWIDGNRTLTGDGWHPYTVSLRIVNWCEAGAYFDLRDAAFHASLYGQARFLAANLERDVGGNHLIKNLRGLLWASCYFAGDEPQRWRATAMSGLEREIAEQVLADGGHFERVPAYHVQVLEDLQSCRALLGNGPAWLDDAIERMTRFLCAIVPPSGRLPLLKDTTFWSAVAPATAFESPRSGATPSHGKAVAGATALQSSGFVVIRDDDRGEFFIIDVGKPCPDHLPAHAHADLFSFELTDADGPLVVDSGVYEYAAGTWRNWFRSTAAHNTVEVAGADQSEMWGSFRVARRARPNNVRWIENGAMRIVQGEHDGYTRLSPAVTHRRTVVVHPGLWLVIDELLGRGTTRAVSRIHLHPERRVEDLHLTAFGGNVKHERGWYSERFGEKRQNDVVAIEVSGEMPLRFGYCIKTSDAIDVLGCAASATFRANAPGD